MTRERQELLPDETANLSPRALVLDEAELVATPPYGGVGQVLFVEPLGGGVWSRLGSASPFCWTAESSLPSDTQCPTTGTGIF